LSVRFLRALTLATFLTAASALLAGAADGLADGRYNCFLFLGKPPKATFTGALLISASTYQVKDQAVRGEYELDKSSGRVRFQGKPPLGFQVGVLEPDGKIRMYITEADIGNKWKAALCSPVEASASEPAGAKSAAAPTTTSPAAGGFKAGDRVETEYAGLWYPGTVTKVERGGYVVHYDDPKWNDVWVEAKRVRAKR
jgi:agenet domain-containing protein